MDDDGPAAAAAPAGLGAAHNTNPELEPADDWTSSDDEYHEPELTGPVELALVDSATSAESILRFMDIVRAWRMTLKEGDRALVGRAATIASMDMPASFQMLLDFRAKADLSALTEVFVSVRLFRIGASGALEVTAEAVDRLLLTRHQNESERETAEADLQRFRKYDRFCNPALPDACDGILCFLPFGGHGIKGVWRDDLEEMEDAEIDVFRSKLLEVEHAKRLCEVGKAFERGVFVEEEFGKRPFEEYEGDIGELGLEELVNLL